jgi:hypothetical protein
MRIVVCQETIYMYQVRALAPSSFTALLERLPIKQKKTTHMDELCNLCA